MTGCCGSLATLTLGRHKKARIGDIFTAWKSTKTVAKNSHKSNQGNFSGFIVPLAEWQLCLGNRGCKPQDLISPSKNQQGYIRMEIWAWGGHSKYITLMKSKTNETRNENLRIHTTSRCISLLLGFARGWKAIANGYITWACAIRKLRYSNATAIQDKSAWKNLYNKTWTNPNILTPGIFLVLCPCPKKSVYGFSLMVKAESPSYIFDIVTTRFETDYRPDWV